MHRLPRSQMYDRDDLKLSGVRAAGPAKGKVHTKASFTSKAHCERYGRDYWGLKLDNSTSKPSQRSLGTPALIVAFWGTSITN